jgi:hypothetical protein
VFVPTFLGGLFCGIEAGAGDIVFDVGQTLHRFDGFGAQMWSGDERPITIAEDFNFQYMRVNVNYDTLWFATGSRNDYDNFWATSTGWHLANIQDTWADLQSIGVEPILVQFGIQDVWLDGSGRFKSEYIDEHANYWGAYVNWINSYGMRPPYIEFFNEPDGTWNGYVSPAIYNEIIKSARAELDYRGFPDVNIVGPGLAHIDRTTDEWIDALDNDAFTAVATWSIHGWDWSDQKNDLHAVLHHWPAFANSVHGRDPGRVLPIFVTEYATNADDFHGVPGNLDSIPWAVRVFQNTLIHINSGASVPLYWQAADMTWDVGNHGLIRVDGSRRPVYFALKSLAPRVPVGASVLRPIVQDGDVYSTAFVNVNRMVVTMSNNTGVAQDKNVRILGVSDVNIIEAKAFVGTPGGEIVDRALVTNADMSIDIMLPSDTTLTVVCDVTPASVVPPGTAKVLEWKLEDDTFDSSGNGNDAGVVGTAIYADGRFGRCMKFDGSANPIVEITDARGLPTGPTDPWTINIWVYPEDDMTSGGTWHGLGLAGFGDGEWGGNEGRERLVGNWGWGQGICFYSIGMQPSNAGTGYIPGQWQMITITFDPAGLPWPWSENPFQNPLKVYRNGNLLHSLNPQGAYYTGGFRFAQAIARLVPETSHISPNTFRGKLDEFSIWSGALTEAQIEKVMRTPGDTGGDGKVDVHDLADLALQWLVIGDCDSTADLDFDCGVDFGDYGILADNWGK